jgi:hypothetical protein
VTKARALRITAVRGLCSNCKRCNQPMLRIEEQFDEDRYGSVSPMSAASKFPL